MGSYMLIEKKKTVEMLPAEYNPRKDLKPGDEEYEKLKRSIEEFGYVEPVIWNKTTGRVVGGHQRLKVLIDLGITEVDCVVVEMDDAKEKALNIALNKISGDWDKDKLTLLIADLQGEDFDVSLTGFDPAEIDDLFKDSLKDSMHDDDFDVDEELKKALLYQGWRRLDARSAPSGLRRFHEKGNLRHPDGRRQGQPRDHGPAVQREL